jgi:hypothetical protein
MDEITRLKKQIKLLVIGLITLGVMTVGLLIWDVAGQKPPEAWPDMTVGKLTVKEVRIVSPDGQAKMILHTTDNAPVLALIDQSTEVRLLLSATAKSGGYLSLVGTDKRNNVYMSSDGILMGDEMQASVRLVAPSDGGPRLLLRDENGYTATIGRTALLDKQNGTQSFTSAASIVGSSKESTVHWPLLNSIRPK